MNLKVRFEILGTIDIELKHIILAMLNSNNANYSQLQEELINIESSIIRQFNLQIQYKSYQDLFENTEIEVV